MNRHCGSRSPRNFIISPTSDRSSSPEDISRASNYRSNDETRLSVNKSYSNI